MNQKFSLLFLTVLLILSGCSTVQVSQDFRDGANFQGLNTFNWHSLPVLYGEDPRENNPLLHQRFQDTIAEVLQERGYERSVDADFLVSYNYSISSRIESYPSTTHFGYGYGRHRYYRGVVIGGSSDIRQYDIGTLVIDFYDSDTDSLLWRGKGTDIAANHPSPQQTSEMVNTLVREILVQFPPQ